MPTIELYDEDGVVEDTYWGAIIALPATNLASTGFTTNWESVTDADGYYLDISTDASFSTFVTGYENLDVSNVTSYAVLVTLADGPYYYRISAYRDTLTSDESNTIEVSLTTVKYGALYNWYAATNARNITSAGWHISTYAQATTLITYLGGNAVAGGKLKEAGLIFWATPNTGATNETNFNMRGGGTRSGINGAFGSLRSNGGIIINNDLGGQYNFMLFSKDNAQAIEGASAVYRTGESIRPLKDSTTLSDGESGTYTGNDGKVYRTICIGTQEWLADNLAETKYGDGSDIPIVTDNAAWAALATGAMCYYNNDENYA
jgi:uncharacterized protein (TIGR02145 family)